MAKSKKRRRGRGEGGIYKRAEGLWVVSLVVGYDAETKKMRRRVVHARTKEEAVRKLQELQQKKAAGTVDPALKLKVQMDWWLDCNIKPSTDPATYALHRQLNSDN